jgi:hypothetical protein
MENLISWFEIPVTDIKRAATFYEKLYEAPITIHDMGGLKMGFLPRKNQGIVSGSLVQHEAYTPSHQGSLLYLNGGDDLNVILSRVEPSGGKILKGKTMISPQMGYMALFQDTEGNRLALLSRN